MGQAAPNGAANQETRPFQALFPNILQSLDPGISVRSGIAKFESESFSVTRAHAHGIDDVKGLDDDEIQDSWRGSVSVNCDRDPRTRAASCPGARPTGVLPEPGCRIPIKRDNGRYGIGTQRFVCERADKAHFSEELR
jgi:hypothetical protein